MPSAEHSSPATSVLARHRCVRTVVLSFGLATAALSTGCEPPARDDAGAAGDSLDVAVPSADSSSAPAPDTGWAGDTSTAAVIASYERLVPRDVRRRQGACPFECCTYRQWTAEGPIPVVARERATGAAAFTMPAGQQFQADSGNVWVTGLQLVAVVDSVADRPYWAFGPGDTLVVLDHLGEGHFNVWHDGEVRDVAGFWMFGPETARVLGRPRSEWWVHVTLPDGRTGWFEAADSLRIVGADACG